MTTHSGVGCQFRLLVVHVYWFRMLLVEIVVGWYCCWLGFLLVEIVVGWCWCCCLVFLLAELVGGWDCSQLRLVLVEIVVDSLFLVEIVGDRCCRWAREPLRNVVHNNISTNSNLNLADGWDCCLYILLLVVIVIGSGSFWLNFFSCIVVGWGHCWLLRLLLPGIVVGCVGWCYWWLGLLLVSIDVCRIFWLRLRFSSNRNINQQQPLPTAIWTSNYSQPTTTTSLSSNITQQ